MQRQVMWKVPQQLLEKSVAGKRENAALSPANRRRFENSVECTDHTQGKVSDRRLWYGVDGSGAGEVAGGCGG